MDAVASSKFLELEICPQLKSSLMLLQKNNIITNEVLRQILDLSLKSILVRDEPNINFTKISSSKPDIIKELYASMCNFLIQAVRCDVSKENLEQYCTETLRINTNYSNIIVDYVVKHRNDIREKLASISTLTQPLLRNVNWKLNYIIKTSEMGSIDSNPIYKICLETLKYNPASDNNEVSHVIFYCDILELTDLVSKLKEACKHVERLTYN